MSTDDLLTRSRAVRARILAGEPLTEAEREALEDLLLQVAATEGEFGVGVLGLTSRLELLVEAADVAPDREDAPRDHGPVVAPQRLTDHL